MMAFLAVSLRYFLRYSFRYFMLALLLALAGPFAHADALADDKKEALAEFIGAYRLAEVWPRMAPKIARDSLPRLEDAIRADIDADASGSRDAADAAQARVARLLPQGRRELEAALQAFDADELAAYTAFEIYAKYFETAEIRDISAFFDSDTGKKLTALAPTLIAEGRRSGTDAALQSHFSEPEMAQITAFWDSPVGRKMNATAEQVREDMHGHFIERSEPALKAVARRLATQAEKADDATGSPPASPAASGNLPAPPPTAPSPAGS